MKDFLTVIGAGLAGSEAAWQAAERGVQVVLYEMRPATRTPAHKTDNCAELVCSNSLGNNLAPSAPFILKEELRSLKSIVIASGDKNSVPAGSALAVDRDLFSQEITSKLSNHPNITFKREEVVEIPQEGPVIIATGPLTSPRLSEQISKLIGQEYLYFYDALSPIVDANSIDYDKAFFASRYDKGDADYLNCPMNAEQYYEFVRELKASEKVPFASFEKPIYFEGCMPVEELADRGDRTLAFGPLKPVGLPDPKTGRMAHAVVQLRRENRESSAYNLVGFQTKLTYPEQKRVFSMIPGLENAEFFRFGAIHRNTYINSPSLLNSELELKSHPGTYFAGQVTGVEGYVESSAMGLLAGLSAVAKITGSPYTPPPADTALGALINYLTASRSKGFQPMNINFGLFWVQGMRIRDKKLRNQKIATNALKKIKEWSEEHPVSTHS
ncbi:MAG: methylenetetrahydrofolate--tRNA-(uracil(54)-C(5))-methyltransferase (FADH(2)-oxidizing) TrmFO [Nitrospina sp.]|nr:methylenetetrahydrofolate--tRNA-(uracil(54)-C(5))-methyltransferase (FADH(2)-oxidizing) TrmFO [Nitrospina sp.]MBT3857886.1 methylenetetrahydrofolate--tRNA-(uracil(54)-C(5))-methyltransferase (FADH(2)-oxidizing) TrmFO [Nitrospina sp.]MBT4103324.1 methylenetetrahydrofolate--tRNA-(uracil(54)-C(5))-methyltransferase (FADH(2)-oxidizing) TrmFO [Nitrospina sp.]MBT4388210.1 methylenetetrahydrofolate--tRNA-(uracil(54)-C(5))-methyltransferase (FADH(2)-oxidizing) TrmFO [Nitrospina sp.]MBT4621959.1 meth